MRPLSSVSHNLVKIGDGAYALRARLAYSDFYEFEKCITLIFTPFGTLWVPLRLDRIRRSPRLGFSMVANPGKARVMLRIL